MDLNSLLTRFVTWWDTLSTSRLKNNEKGASWLLKAMSYDGPLTQEDQQQFFQRDELNKKYVERYNENTGLPYSMIETEIHHIAAFERSFVLRNKTRMEIYRDSLSQMRLRQRSVLGICAAKHYANLEQVEIKE